MVFGLRLLNSKYVFNGIISISLTLLMVQIISVGSEATTITESTTTTTTMSPGIECSLSNSSCEDCVKNSSCFYCFSDSKCKVYVATRPSQDCESSKKMAWKTCLVKFNVLVIVLGSLGGILLLALIICCCCCCRKVKRAQLSSQLAKWERQRADRKAHQDERRQEREARRNEIRQKYGLGMVDNNKYSRFD